MKTIVKLSLVTVLFIFLSSCSSTKITYDKQVDFSQYKTFAFYKKGIDHLKIPNKKKRFVLKTITQALQKKGFSKSSHPDLVVNIFTNIHNRIDVYSSRYAPYYRRHQYVEKSKEGTIYIDIVDMKQKKVVWSAKRYISFERNDYRALKKAIYKLLAKFPPK